jgi:magnesium chelatase subunit I
MPLNPELRADKQPGNVPPNAPAPASISPPEPVPFPFSALVGQQALQRALLLVAVDPGIGGVLIGGPRGTAKSTAARALAALLPQAPFVTLPLAASLEQLVGTLSIEDALQSGAVRLSPGLVARAHGGVLYVDEVNLLPDALVDALLDVAASGVNTVERDGISQRHAARFVLVGTMNPEEGELRPQLLDRFGLSVWLHNPTDAQQRLQIVRSRLLFDADPTAVAASHADALQNLAATVLDAQALLPRVQWPDDAVAHAGALALAAGVDGVRADLVMLRAARASAALDGRDAVTVADVDAVAELALHHRRQAGAQQPTPPAAPPSAQKAQAPNQGQNASSAQPDSAGASGADGDWGAMPPVPVGTVRPAAAGVLPPKKT